jgi:hypothetical protein
MGVGASKQLNAARASAVAVKNNASTATLRIALSNYIKAYDAIPATNRNRKTIQQLLNTAKNANGISYKNKISTAIAGVVNASRAATNASKLAVSSRLISESEAAQAANNATQKLKNLNTLINHLKTIPNRSERIVEYKKAGHKTANNRQLLNAIPPGNARRNIYTAFFNRVNTNNKLKNLNDLMASIATLSNNNKVAKYTAFGRKTENNRVLNAMKRANGTANKYKNLFNKVNAARAAPSPNLSPPSSNVPETLTVATPNKNPDNTNKYVKIMRNSPNSNWKFVSEPNASKYSITPSKGNNPVIKSISKPVSANKRALTAAMKLWKYAGVGPNSNKNESISQAISIAQKNSNVRRNNVTRASIEAILNAPNFAPPTNNTGGNRERHRRRVNRILNGVKSSRIPSN